MASLRKQLREALAVGEVVSRVRMSDVAAEVELCQEKYTELKDLADGLQSAQPTSRAKQRVRQRLHHLFMRLQNLETQPGSTEMETALAFLRDQVATALQEPPSRPNRPPKGDPRPPSLEVEDKRCLLYTSRCV